MDRADNPSADHDRAQVAAATPSWDGGDRDFPGTHPVETPPGKGDQIRPSAPPEVNPMPGNTDEPGAPDEVTPEEPSVIPPPD